MTFIQRLRGETGEGVISTGIAILIMAVIGGVMFVALKGVMSDANKGVEGEIAEISGDGE